MPGSHNIDNQMRRFMTYIKADKVSTATAQFLHKLVLYKALHNPAMIGGSNTIDLFGDANEYLMTMYDSTAGKSGGEFYTSSGRIRIVSSYHRSR